MLIRPAIGGNLNLNKLFSPGLQSKTYDIRSMRFLFISGIIFFIGSIVLIISNYEKLKVQYDGKIVKMRIEKLPSSCLGSKFKYFVIFSYNGKIYDKQTSGSYCEKHHIGELVDMKMLEGSEKILFPKESALFSLLSFAALGLFGLVLSIVQWKKMR